VIGPSYRKRLLQNGGVIMLKRFAGDNRGYTLVEIMITLIIASVVLVALGSFLVRNIRYNVMANDQVFIQDQIRKTLKGIGNLIMDKKTVDVSTVGDITTATFNEGKTDEMVLKWDKDTNELTYNDGGSDKILGRYIADFKVRQDADNSRLVIVEITGLKDKAEFSTTEKYFLRN
jgi:prepilin-type N-terminal cleavage/methylation domain-containing protein